VNTAHLSLFACGAFIPFFPLRSFSFVLVPAFLLPPLTFFAVVFFDFGYGESVECVITGFE
jgi:hypothetical protein